MHNPRLAGGGGGERADRARRVARAGGCCDGSSPMCHLAGECRTGASDLLLAALDVDAVPEPESPATAHRPTGPRLTAAQPTAARPAAWCRR